MSVIPCHAQKVGVHACNFRLLLPFRTPHIIKTSYPTVHSIFCTSDTAPCLNHRLRFRIRHHNQVLLDIHDHTTALLVQATYLFNPSCAMRDLWCHEPSHHACAAMRALHPNSGHGFLSSFSHFTSHRLEPCLSTFHTSPSSALPAELTSIPLSEQHASLPP